MFSTVFGVIAWFIGAALVMGLWRRSTTQHTDVALVELKHAHASVVDMLRAELSLAVSQQAELRAKYAFEKMRNDLEWMAKMSATTSRLTTVMEELQQRTETLTLVQLVADDSIAREQRYAVGVTAYLQTIGVHKNDIDTLFQAIEEK